MGLLTQRWSARGLTVVAVNSNDTDAYPDDAPWNGWHPRLAPSGGIFPYLVDTGAKVAEAFRAACTPDFFLFDGTGTLTYRGRFDTARPGNDIPSPARTFGPPSMPCLTELPSGGTASVDGLQHQVACGPRAQLAWLGSQARRTPRRPRSKGGYVSNSADVNDSTATLEVVNRPEDGRYELLRDGSVIGHAAYSLNGDEITIPHVETDPALRNQGLGSALMAA